MKKKILTLFAALAFVNCYAQTNTYPWPSNADIGIGTTTPEQRLTIVMNGSENGSGIAIKAVNGGGAGSQPSYTFLNPSGVKRMYSYLDVSSDTYNIGNAIGIPLLTIKQAGNIGIGTTVPEQRLTIVMNGSENGSGIAIKAVNSGGAGSQPSYTFLNPSGLKRMYSYLDVSSDTYNIGNAVGTSLLTIKQAGNIGIGTLNPDEKLAVNGTVHAREVKVDSNTWPDFVFQPTYKLLSLPELKAYINQHHHLPNVPSAEQVAKEGLSLGEVNARLLQKIEELTIYLIKSDKNNREQETRLNRLEHEISQLRDNPNK
jgi:hypothetical protein